jgi:hypothetical protein
MKHHVLLGLILGLLATGRLGAQVLFDVQITPSTRTVVITATGTPPTPIANEVGNTIYYYEGITFLNFFSAGTTSGISEVGDSVGTLTQRGPLDPVGIKVFPSTIPADRGWLIAYDVWTPIIPEALPNGVTNSTSNLNLFALSTYVDSNRPSDDFTTSTNSNFGNDSVFLAQSAVKIVFDSSYTFSSDPAAYSNLLVYAGYNNTFDGDSFLGTYTITVVPEPSTYAAIAGGLGLVAAVLHRRRQRARATAA